MKQMSQMKEMIIAAVAVATLMSCQSQEDKAITEYLELEKEWLWNAKYHDVAYLSNQDSILQYMAVLEYKMDSLTQYLPK